MTTVFFLFSLAAIVIAYLVDVGLAPSHRKATVGPEPQESDGTQDPPEAPPGARRPKSHRAAL